MLDGLPIPLLEPGVVQLWHAPVAEVSRDLSSGLTDEERSRAARFVFAANRQEFVIGRALVRLVLSRNLDVLPGDVQFRSGPYGKPELECRAGPSPIHFNVSHSAGMVVAAFSREGQVGIDVEDEQREISPAVMRQVFTPSELAQIAALPQDERRAAAAARWTLKEAWLKACGAGLNVPLLAFSLDQTAGGPPRIRFSPPIADNPARWRFEQWRLPPRHVVSLALCDSHAAVTHHDFASLLNSQVPNDRSLEPLVAIG